MKTRQFFVKKDTQSPVSESVEGRVSYKGSIKDIIKDLLGGIELGMQYAGTPTIDELKENAEFVLITESSRQESHPHNVLITKESSNYTIQI